MRANASPCAFKPTTVVRGQSAHTKGLHAEFASIVIPREVEAVTRVKERPGFPSLIIRSTSRKTCLEYARHDKKRIRVPSFCPLVTVDD